jgi:hypothetical protein
VTSPAKAKGSAWERAVRDWTREHLDPRAYKPHEEGFEDVGDLHLFGGQVVVQAKDWRSWEDAIREGLDGAVRQAEAWDRKTAGVRPGDAPRGITPESAVVWRCECGVRGVTGADGARAHVATAHPAAPSLPVAIVKRARRPVGDAYAVVRLSDLARLLRRAYGP